MEEEWIARLGTCYDHEIARIYGLNRRAVCSARLKRGIPAFTGFVLSQEGRPLRSVEEAKLDAYFHWKGVEHEHEVRVPGTTMVADFRLSNGTYAEVIGMKGYPRYDKRFQEKYHAYDNLAVPISYFEPGSIDYLMRDCPVQVKTRERFCFSCKKTLSIKDKVANGRCRPCAMVEWRSRGKKLVICSCGKSFKKQSNSPQKFCSRSCYWASLKAFELPPWSEIDRMRETLSVPQIAKKLNISANALFQRIYRRKD